MIGCQLRRSAVLSAMLSAALSVAWFVVFASNALGQLEVEAVPGEPFGVGRVSVRLPERATEGLSGLDAFELTERNGRVLYPARNAGLLDRIAEDGGDPRRLSIMFLFRGTQPLDLMLQADQRYTARVEPRAPARGRNRVHDRLLNQWWRQYNAAAQQMVDRGGYPALADHYLVAMLSRRLGLAPTIAGRKLFPSADAEKGLGLLLGTESLHAAVLQETMQGERRDGAASERVPVAEFPPLVVPAAKGDVRIEPIALHVPEECYYIRFGSWANYRWMRDLMTDFGGDLGNMISARGLDFDQSGRMEQRLALRETTLGNLFGGQVISDVALVGLDMFHREGAAVGMLFEARSTKVLENDIKKQRSNAQAADKRAVLSTVKIAGHDVSLLATPDFTIRSFHAIDGDYHLVTSSETMVRRFFEAGAKKRSLGESAEFRHAREQIPTSRNDTVFAYLSDAFIRNLLSPAYRIEMSRRLTSAVEMDAATLATLAAKAEGVGATSYEQLGQAGFLPQGFGRRADGSELVVAADGSMRDSLRGVRGSFIPVADMEIRSATPREVDDYARFAESYRSSVGRLEPIMVAIRRTAGDRPDVSVGMSREAKSATSRAAASNAPPPADSQASVAGRGDPPPAKDVEGKDVVPKATLPKNSADRSPPPPEPTPDGIAETKPVAKSAATKDTTKKSNGSNANLETLSIEARVSPFTGKTYQTIADRVGPATKQYVAPLSGNLVSLSAVLKNGGLGGFLPGAARADDGESRLMFAGLGDFSQAVEAPSGFMGWLQILKQTNGYVGSYPEAGTIGRLLGLDKPLPEGEMGYHEIFGRLLGLWAMRQGSFSVVAINKDELLSTARQLRVVEAERPAQVRLAVSDLRGTNLGATLSNMGYSQTRLGSSGNARYLHRLAEQFHIPRADTLPLAEKLCGAKLICPLGGQYKLADRAGGGSSWTSTAWKRGGERTAMPTDYVAPPLVWFRRLDAEATLEASALAVRAELVVERKSNSSLGLPSLLGR